MQPSQQGNIFKDLGGSGGESLVVPEAGSSGEVVCSVPPSGPVGSSLQAVGGGTGMDSSGTGGKDDDEDDDDESLKIVRKKRKQHTRPSVGMETSILYNEWDKGWFTFFVCYCIFCVFV